MTYGVWLSTAGLQTNEYKQAVFANNLANTGTVGFKHDLAVVHERAMESASSGNARYGHAVLDGLTGGAWVRPTIHTFEQGVLEQTKNPLDVAIQGDGFFAVREGKETRYTRDGRFTMGANGELVMAAGGGRRRVLDVEQQPIVLDPAGGEAVDVGFDGTVRQGGQVVGEIGIFEFAERGQLSKLGGSLYRNDGAGPIAAVGSEVRGGFVEQSTANPIEGLAAMIEASRAYEMNANMITMQDETIGQAISRVGRLG